VDRLIRFWTEPVWFNPGGLTSGPKGHFSLFT
jgi:hypothetical protein